MAPSTTSATWVRRSRIARKMFSLADSPRPRMLTATRKAITATPPMMSPGEWRSAGKNAPR